MLQIQNSKDSADPKYSLAQKMKISLFIKSYIAKAFSFLFILTVFFLTSFPVSVQASFFDSLSELTSGITAMVLGTEVTADETDTISDASSGASSSTNTSNSQNMNLNITSESSVNPDLKSVNDNKDIVVVAEDSFIYNEGSYIPDVKFEKSPISDQIRVYTVAEGDTLSSIADTFDVSVNTIRWENNISGSILSVGKKLNILPVTGIKHIVASGDTVSKIASKYDADKEDIIIFNGMSDGVGLKKGDVIFVPNGTKPATVATSKTTTSKVSSSSQSAPSGYYIRPTSGRVTSSYGSRKGSFHYGIDMGGGRGASVVASASGTVIQVVSSCREGVSYCGGRYGNYIIIEHPNGQRTRYAHLQKVKVHVGQSVDQGDLIGLLGNTGRSTGPHLHFEVIKSNGSTVRPPFK